MNRAAWMLDDPTAQTEDVFLKDPKYVCYCVHALVASHMSS